MNYEKAKFLLSVANLDQLPEDEGVEIAFAGRSNAGKSSVLNQLTRNKGLARVSKTPGRTQHINLFALDDNHRIADLPGYGYAKVPLVMKDRWKKLLDGYMRTRESLKGIILVMDIRHPLKEFDLQLLAWCSECQIPVHILLNKSDKLSRSAIKQTQDLISKHIRDYSNPVTFQTFSALKGLGLDELRAQLDTWSIE